MTNLLQGQERALSKQRAQQTFNLYEQPRLYWLLTLCNSTSFSPSSILNPENDTGKFPYCIYCISA